MERGIMPTNPSNIFDSELILIFVKGAILLLLIFYSVFALLIIRQVDLMSRTLISGVSSIIKMLALFHAGFAIGLIFLTWWIL